MFEMTVGEPQETPKCGVCKLWGMDRDAVAQSTWGDGTPVDLCPSEMISWDRTATRYYI